MTGFIKKHRYQLQAAAGIAAALLILAVFRYSTFDGFENSRDCFYHMRMGLEGWNTAAAKTFPATAMSSWSTRFADKELLYHLITGNVQAVAFIFGAEAFPFHVPALFFMFLALAAFALAARSLKVGHLWFFIPLLVCAESAFTGRFLMLRPHVFAIALMLFSCFVFTKAKGFSMWWSVLLTGFVFSWSYSNPHFLLLTAGAFAAGAFLNRDWKRGLTAIVFSIAGLAAGMILHPQFPNTLTNWKIQCVDVVLTMFSGSGAVVVVPGDEILLSGRFMLKSFALPLIFLINSAMVFFAVRRKGRRFFTTETSAVVILAAATFAGTFLTMRAVEYSIPFNVLCLAYLSTREKMPSWTTLPRNMLFRIVAGAIVLAVSGWICFSGIERSMLRDRPLYELASFMAEKHIPDGTLTGNVNWSDFPSLYYVMPHYRYLCGLDPSFGYSAFPERMKALEEFRTGRRRLLPEELVKITGTRLFFVSAYNAMLAKDMFGTGYKIVYQGRDGWLFHAPPPSAK